MTRHLLLLIALLACSPADRTARSPTSVLHELDSIVLIESDSTFIGEPAGMIATHDGSILVSDTRNGTLHRFGVDGRSQARIGSRGPGPGEWVAGPYTLYRASDSLAVVSDGIGRLKGIAYPSGEERWSTTIAPASQPVGARGGQVMLGATDVDGRTTLILTSPNSDDGVPGGPYPDILDANPFVRELFATTAMTWIAPDTIAVAFQHSDGVFVGRYPDGPFDHIVVPPIARRGAEQMLLRGIDPNDTRTIERAIYQPSYPLALAMLPSSSLLALVTSDMTFVDGTHMTGRLFLSLVDLEQQRSCPDAALPGPADPLPHVAFHGDTLLLLTQTIEGAVARSVIRRFLPSGDDCQWVDGAS